MTEFLVTAQGYEKTDTDKQTILLHDSYIAKDQHDAKEQFMRAFEPEYNIINIYSITDISAAT